MYSDEIKKLADELAQNVDHIQVLLAMDGLNVAEENGLRVIVQKAAAQAQELETKVGEPKRPIPARVA